MSAKIQDNSISTRVKKKIIDVCSFFPFTIFFLLRVVTTKVNSFICKSWKSIPQTWCTELKKKDEAKNHFPLVFSTFYRIEAVSSNSSTIPKSVLLAFSQFRMLCAVHNDTHTYHMYIYRFAFCMKRIFDFRHALHRFKPSPPATATTTTSSNTQLKHMLCESEFSFLSEFGSRFWIILFKCFLTSVRSKCV